MKQRKKQIFAVLASFGFIVVMLCMSSAAYAHGIGQTITKVVGEYIIDVDYDVPTLVAGQSVRFDLLLRSATTNGFVAFDTVWVSIRPRGEQGGTFAGELSFPKVGNPGMSITFPEAGSYDLSVRYQRNGSGIAETVFPLEVAGPSGGAFATATSRGLLLGVVPGIIVGFVVGRLKKKQ